MCSKREPFSATKVRQTIRSFTALEVREVDGLWLAPLLTGLDEQIVRTLRAIGLVDRLNTDPSVLCDDTIPARGPAHPSVVEDLAGAACPGRAERVGVSADRW
jgi:hypothetical protein